MIQQGDTFTFRDLRQSMHEICRYDLHKCINTKKSNVNIIIGDYGINLCQSTPKEYAATCIQAYGNIPSSAKHLDQQIRDKGFKTTYRFSYNYRNGGLTPEEIVNDAYCLDWFQQIYKTAVPYAKYEDEYFDILNDAFCLSYYYAQYLWTHNRGISRNMAKELRCPDTSQWPQIISALLGIGFQFHPNDVYEHAIKFISPNMTKKQFDAQNTEQMAFKKEIQTNYGIDTGCLVLSQQSREKLHKILTRTDTNYFIQVINNILLGHNR